MRNPQLVLQVWSVNRTTGVIGGSNHCIRGAIFGSSFKLGLRFKSLCAVLFIHPHRGAWISKCREQTSV